MENHNKINLGRLGEELACHYLKSRNYRIIARNWRCEMGEIDIVAINQDLSNINDIAEKVVIDINSLKYRTILNINDKIGKCHLFLSYILSYIHHLINEGFCYLKYIFDRFVKLFNNKVNSLVFVEVKTMFQGQDLIPEDNITLLKKDKLLKISRFYMLNHGLALDLANSIDVIAISVDLAENKAILSHYRNIISDFK